MADVKSIELPSVKSKEEFKKWLKTYQEESGETFRVKWSTSCDTTYILYRANYVCHHNTLPVKACKRPSKKHTGCPVEMKVHIRTARETLATSCKVDIIGKHNHPLKDVDITKFNRVSISTKERFMELFKLGHTPVQALQAHKQDMMERFGEDYLMHVADRSLCPDMNWVYSLFSREFKKHTFDCSSEKTFMTIASYVDKLRKAGYKVEMGIVESDFFVVLITDLAERVHILESSSQVAFFNSLGVMDVQKKCRAFSMMTHSAVGGLPVGYFVYSSDAEGLMTESLLAYKELLACDAFGGRGSIGPQVFIIDDCVVSRSALGTAFPSSTLLVSVNHVLESSWRWMWNGYHKVGCEDRKVLFRNLSQLVRCKSSSEFELCFQACVSNETVKKHQTYVAFLKKLFENSHYWALCFHEELDVRGINSNITDICFGVLRDKVFFQVRLFSVDRILDFIINNLNKFYQKKIVSIVTDKYEQFLESAYGCTSSSDLQVIETGDGIHKVLSALDNILYEVAFFLGRCECPVGSFGGPCKHQHAVALYEHKNLDNGFPSSSEDKNLLCWLATGSFSSDTALFRSLGFSSQNLEVVDVVPDVGHEVDLEMEIFYDHVDATETDNDNGNSQAKEKVQAMLSEITTTVMEHVPNADESFYESLVKFYDKFKTVSGSTSTIQNFLNMCDGSNSANNTIILIPPPVMNYSIPVGKLPIPPLHANEVKTNASSERNQKQHTYEHGYAAQPKHKR